MGKASLSWLAVALTLAGTAVLTGHPAWGTVTGGAILLLAAGAATGAIRTKSERHIEKQRVAGQKVSNSLVTLSSAAILAVYAAGYHRTRAAEEKFEAQAARRRAAESITATAVTPPAAIPGASALPATPRSTVPPPRKHDPRPSSTTARNASPASAPTGDSQATSSEPSAAGTSADRLADLAATLAAPQQVQYKDGVYSGWGYSRHGNIQASVLIVGGAIASTKIVTCATQYNCMFIDPLLQQVVTRQSPNIHHVSGATDSSNAFSDAVAQALSQASE